MLLATQIVTQYFASRRLGVSRMPSDLVGVAGFEPAASSSRTKRAAKLRYTPPRAPKLGAERTLDSLAETLPGSDTAARRRPPGCGAAIPGRVSWNRVKPG